MTYYYIILHYIKSYIYFINYLQLFEGSNGKVKLDRSRLQQLDNSSRKLVREADGGGSNIIQSLFSSDLHFL